MTAPLIGVQGELMLVDEPAAAALEVYVTVLELEEDPVLFIRLETGTAWKLRLGNGGAAFIAGALAERAGADVFIRPGRS